MMVDKKDDTDASLARKAYSMANSTLRKQYEEEFNKMLDAAYADLGIESPRIKREKKKAEAEKAKAEAAQKREERRLARIARLEEELAKAKGAAAPEVNMDDPFAPVE